MRGRVRFKLGLGLDGRRDVIDDDVDDPGVDLFAFNSVLTDETSRRRRYLPSMLRMMPKGAQRRPRKWAVAAVGLEGGGGRVGCLKSPIICTTSVHFPW